MLNSGLPISFNQPARIAALPLMGRARSDRVSPYCRLLPPREIAKSFSANGVIGWGRWGSKISYLNKSHRYTALQPPLPANRNNWNKDAPEPRTVGVGNIHGVRAN